MNPPEDDDCGGWGVPDAEGAGGGFWMALAVIGAACVGIAVVSWVLGLV